ncbi:Hypp8932 [Branchiostoma lanceolatum]|uniref:Hypp8932 protein n=1 Tax=Branchiostoma lanceolatum TaxID=7740 RepID=A0A8K0EJS7_BRALA|nr:Hypp8932 [Branchiostoma lanceolatum]
MRGYQKSLLLLMVLMTIFLDDADAQEKKPDCKGLRSECLHAAVKRHPRDLAADAFHVKKAKENDESVFLAKLRGNL